METYDLFVIGGGSGGLAAAKKAADLGKKVAVADYVDPSWANTTWGIGGTCLNVGCIPKKLFHHSAIHREEHMAAVALGWDTKASHNWEVMVNNVQMYIKKQVFGHKTDLRSKKVKYYNHIATFGEKKEGNKFTIELFKGRPEKGGTLETTVAAENVLIATGGRPNDGGYEGAENCISSDDIFSQKKPPGKTLVVGASYIALECAGFTHGLGFDTTVMMRSIPLRGFDQDCAGRIVDFMKSEGVKFEEKKVPTRFVKEGDKVRCFATDASAKSWPKASEVTHDHHRNEQDLGLFDTVLLAIGRTGCAKWIKADRVGVETNRSGDKFIVDDKDATNVPGIYAIGDVAEGRPELTPVAIQSGRLLAKRLANDGTQLMDYKTIATTVFTPLEYACCGISEEETELGLPGEFTIYYSLYTPIQWRPATFDNEHFKDKCLVKMITETMTEKVVGLHILGPNAGETMQGFVVAMKMGVTKQVIDETVGIHPTSAEEIVGLTLIKSAGEDLQANEGC
jgi:thioredoxin reductase (NADPH)